VAFGQSLSGDTLILNSPSIGGASTFAALQNVAPGDRIDFGGDILVNGVTQTAIGGGAYDVTVSVTQGATAGVISFDNVTFGGGAGLFLPGTDTNADASIEAAVPCFAAGTRIATEHGGIAVEHLRVGDTVRALIADGGEPIVWIGRSHVDCARHPRPTQVWPVRIATGAFGPGRPHAGLFLSPDHAVYVGEVLIPVKHLINGSSITQVPVARVTYYHLELPAHDVVLAEGLPTESFLGMKDGSNYANRSGPIRLYPDFSARMWEAFGCARLIVAGPELAAAQALVRRFARVQRAA